MYIKVFIIAYHATRSFMFLIIDIVHVRTPSRKILLSLIILRGRVTILQNYGFNLDVTSLTMRATF